MNRARAIGYVIVYANSKSEELFGYHHGELVGTPVTALDAPGNERQDVAAEMFTALDQSGEWRGEVRLARKDGTSFWCDSSISTFGHAAHGRVRVSVHTDITVRKGMERQLQDVNDRLEARVSERTRELRSAIDELSRELLERKLAQEALRQSQVRLGSVISQAPVILWAIGAGLGPVLIARWFWWRVNAWSELAAIATSTVVGIVTFLLGWPTHHAILLVVPVSLAVTIAATFLEGFVV